MEDESLTITDTEILRELAVLITLSDERTIVLTLEQILEASSTAMPPEHLDVQ